MIVTDLREAYHCDAGIVAFGFFDAIHIGHRAVIAKAVELAHEHGVPASVFMFKNNIYPLIGIDKRPLYTFPERVYLIEKLGVDRIFYIDADKAFLSLSSVEFLDFISEHLRVIGFVCGSDFSFGKGAVGTPDEMRNRFGSISAVLTKTTLPLEGTNGAPTSLDSAVAVSTDLIKRSLLVGDLRTAESCLGRRFSIKRYVRKGRSDGRKIGFPTINFETGDLPLKRGVYFSNVILQGKTLPSVTNVGTHPTFFDEKENIETFILDYSGDLYGVEVEVEFLSYRRGIRAFASEEELARVIGEDVAARRSYNND